MIFGQDRSELRRMYAEAWQKRLEDLPLSPLEAQIVAVIEQHPAYEYSDTDDDVDRNYSPEGGQTNPFLHMGLHLGIREQVATDRPAGIAAVYQILVSRMGDPHAAEHQKIECLAETLWEAQSQTVALDEARYLERLRRL